MKQILANYLKKLGIIKDEPLADMASCGQFLDQRAAYIAQTTLYSYVKARAGTRYPVLFENEAFLVSLKIARWHIFAACLSDLALFLAARLARDGRKDRAADHQTIARLASQLVTQCLEQAEQDDLDRKELLAYGPAFARRVKGADLFALADGDRAFELSPGALVRWAPIDEKMKADDSPNLLNNLGLRWLHVRQDMTRRLDSRAVLADFIKKAGKTG